MCQTRHLTWLFSLNPWKMFKKSSRLCGEWQVPVIPFGTGTSLEGHVNAPAGGISIDLSRMNRILKVYSEDLNVVVEPGVTRKQLNEYLRDTGLFFPIDPGANASLGGMAATRASGTNAVRYGTMRENVLALKAVMPDGRLITTSKRVKKTSAGYDLTRLLVGSEGTLGVITELTLKLYGIPQAISGGICAFPDLESACNAVIETIQMGIPVARIELVNQLEMQAMIAYSKLDYEPAPYLFAGVPRQRNERGGTGGAFRRDRGRQWRRRVQVDSQCRRAREALVGAAQFLLCLHDPCARKAIAFDGCLRADFPACRMHRRDREGH